MMGAFNYSNLFFPGGSLVINPIQKFDKSLIIDPKEDFVIFWIILGKLLIATTEIRRDRYPNLTFD
jgi:hypothetical protein